MFSPRLQIAVIFWKVKLTKLDVKHNCLRLVELYLTLSGSIKVESIAKNFWLKKNIALVIFTLSNILILKNENPGTIVLLESMANPTESESYNYKCIHTASIPFRRITFIICCSIQNNKNETAFTKTRQLIENHKNKTFCFNNVNALKEIENCSSMLSLTESKRQGTDKHSCLLMWVF